MDARGVANLGLKKLPQRGGRESPLPAKGEKSRKSAWKAHKQPDLTPAGNEMVHEFFVFHISHLADIFLYCIPMITKKQLASCLVKYR